MIDSKGRTYIKIYCCGDCVQYNWRMHRCKLGAHVDGTAGDCFYLDCPYLKEEKEHTWIPVSERLPEDDRSKVVTLANGNTEVGYYSNGDWWCIGDSFRLENPTVIAWMPLPNPYEVEE